MKIFRWTAASDAILLSPRTEEERSALFNYGCGRDVDRVFDFVSTSGAPQFLDNPPVGGMNSRLLSRRAYESLKGFMTGWEPKACIVDGDSDGYVLCRTLERFDAMGPDGNLDGLRRVYDFDLGKLPAAGAFVVQGPTGGEGLFVTDEFVSVVETMGFTGFRFPKVWDDAIGGYKAEFVDGDLVLVPIAR